ncbi:hypothetical protein CNECB9_1640023 [Cupriavidus necator]|uniref:Uncharacterized protein n=1 Tax=Cupriavidus necator TaxID=106590 RepID=A0A1K0IAA7_CUPNE|nr:hypothetical protein CNECB9_1640023 [Cupriavidus necator]
MDHFIQKIDFINQNKFSTLPGFLENPNVEPDHTGHPEPPRRRARGGGGRRHHGCRCCRGADPRAVPHHRG